MKVYIASPLFNEAEKRENERIDEVLIKAGYETFLPQRDGFLYSELVEQIKKSDCKNEEAEIIAINLISHLDIYQVCKGCKATVLNLNGRVPDEGGVSEGALCFRSEIPLVIYKEDSRTLIGGKDNPLVVGLTRFIIANEIGDIPNKLEIAINQKKSDYSIIMGVAEKLFGDYNPKSRNLDNIIQLGMKHFIQ